MAKKSNLDKLAEQVSQQLSEPNGETDATIPAAEGGIIPFAEQPEPGQPSPTTTPDENLLESAPIDKEEAILSDTQIVDQVKTTLPPPPDPDLAMAIANLDPAALAKLRLALQKSGFDKTLARDLPGGYMEFKVVLSPDVIEPLKAWAESAGTTLEDQVQVIAEQSINAYIFQDWGAPAEAPKTTPAATTTTPATPAPPAAATTPAAATQ